jgi:hypothetical protein
LGKWIGGLRSIVETGCDNGLALSMPAMRVMKTLNRLPLIAFGSFITWPGAMTSGLRFKQRCEK